MPLFYYTARDSEGNLSSEVIKAKNIEEARFLLDSKSIQYFNLIEAENIPLLSRSTISKRNILFFTRYFSVLIQAGVTVFKALNILEKQEKNISFKQKIGVIRKDIEGGKNIYQAFSRFIDIFGVFYCNLLRIGEETGKLADILNRLAEYIENQLELRKRIISVIIYPAILSLLISGITLFLFTFIVPKFSELYWQLGLDVSKPGTLPLITEIMIKISIFIRENLIIGIAIILLIILFIFELYQTKGGRYLIDDFLLNIPILKDIIIRYNLSIFSSNLSILFESGYSVLKSFDMAIEIIQNFALKKRMQGIITSLEAGKGIAQSFKEIKDIPILTTEMIEIGEETASFDKMLRYIAEFYNKELQYLINTFVSLIEPTLIMFLGLIVLTVLLAIYLPIFKLAASIKV